MSNDIVPSKRYDKNRTVIAQALTQELPHNLEAERSILGCILHDDSKFDEVKNMLTSNDFYNEKHRIIYDIMHHLRLINYRIDMTTVYDVIKRKGVCDIDMAFFIHLQEEPPSYNLITSHAQIVKNESQRRSLIEIGNNILQTAYHPENCSVASIAESASSKIQKLSRSVQQSIITVKKSKPIEDYVDIYIDDLKNSRGKEFIGICQITIPEIDNRLLGLRGLMLLAAGPNVGKTTLALQLMLDSVINNQDTCAIFVSLEMSYKAIFSRMISNLAKIDWKAMTFGKFVGNEYERFEQACKDMRDHGQRIKILDSESYPDITIENLLAHVRDLKEKTKCARAIVVVDYLQVWPVPDEVMRKLKSEIDVDKWRIDQMKKLRDAMNHEPIIVISEARKPDSQKKWAGDMSDIMGSARTTYTPDVVFLFWPMDKDELFSLMSSYGNWNKDQKEEVCNEIQEYHKKNGYVISNLRMIKGRDGMTKGDIYLKYFYKENRFEQVDWTKEVNLLFPHSVVMEM